MPETYPVFSIRDWAIVDGRVQCPRCGGRKYTVLGLWGRLRMNEQAPAPEGLIGVTCKCDSCRHVWVEQCLKAEAEWTE